MSGLLIRMFRRNGALVFSSKTSSNSMSGRLVAAKNMSLPIKGKRILDVGCWTGEFLNFLTEELPSESFGIDIDGPWIVEARTNVPSAKFISVSSLNEIPKKYDSYFGLITFLETIEHLPKNQEVNTFNALSKLLSKGGEIIFSTPAAGLSALLDPAWFLVGHRHYRFHTLTRILSSSELQVKEVYYFGNFWTSIDTIFLYITKHILRKNYSTPIALHKLLSSKLSNHRNLFSTNIFLKICRTSEIV